MTEERKDIPFIITLSYLAAFMLIRLSVFIAGAAETEFAKAAKAGMLPGVRFHVGRNIILFGYHIHHFYIGIFLICLAGWLSLTGSRRFTLKFKAVMYGAGLGLFFDEIGLLLTWGDYYSRLTYFLSLLLAGIFLNIIFFPGFWESVKKNIQDSRSGSMLRGILLKHNNFMRFADLVSEKTGKPERTSLVFTGVLYIIISLLVIMRPGTVRYWIALVFIIQGLDYFLKFFTETGRCR